jgi:large subunit ribosomal protein L21
MLGIGAVQCILERSMYAVIDVGGKQLRVSPDESVKVPLMDVEVGAEVTFDRVLALRSDSKVKVGTPVVQGAKVVASVVAHGREKKIIGGKYKRRKFYRRKWGHRQHYTEVKISKIVG